MRRRASKGKSVVGDITLQDPRYINPVPGAFFSSRCTYTPLSLSWSEAQLHKKKIIDSILLRCSSQFRSSCFSNLEFLSLLLPRRSVHPPTNPTPVMLGGSFPYACRETILSDEYLHVILNRRCGSRISAAKKASMERKFSAQRKLPSKDALVSPVIDVNFNIIAINNTVAGGWIPSVDFPFQHCTILLNGIPALHKYRVKSQCSTRTTRRLVSSSAW